MRVRLCIGGSTRNDGHAPTTCTIHGTVTYGYGYEFHVSERIAPSSWPTARGARAGGGRESRPGERGSQRFKRAGRLGSRAPVIFAPGARCPVGGRSGLVVNLSDSNAVQQPHLLIVALLPSAICSVLLISSWGITFWLLGAGRAPQDGQVGLREEA